MGTISSVAFILKFQLSACYVKEFIVHWYLHNLNNNAWLCQCESTFYGHLQSIFVRRRMSMFVLSIPKLTWIHFHNLVSSLFTTVECPTVKWVLPVETIVYSYTRINNPSPMPYKQYKGIFSWTLFKYSKQLSSSNWKIVLWPLFVRVFIPAFTLKRRFQVKRLYLNNLCCLSRIAQDGP
jgi:hypothetical protein